MVAAVVAVRESPRDGRQVEASGFEEEGDTVRWHLSATLPGMGANDSELIQESELRAVFNADDVIQEVWSEEAESPHTRPNRSATRRDLPAVDEDPLGHRPGPQSPRRRPPSRKSKQWVDPPPNQARRLAEPKPAR